MLAVAVPQESQTLARTVGRLADANSGDLVLIVADSKEKIGLDESHFRAALSCALELAGAEPLASLSSAAAPVIENP